MTESGFSTPTGRVSVATNVMHQLLECVRTPANRQRIHTEAAAEADRQPRGLLDIAGLGSHGTSCSYLSIG